jgi:hypothetical protein
MNASLIPLPNFCIFRGWIRVLLLQDVTEALNVPAPTLTGVVELRILKTRIIGVVRWWRFGHATD